MSRGRLEAFSDGVIAIIITIMVLELRPPEARALSALRPLLPVFLSYVLSFVYVGIYWNNHHHLMHTVRTVNGWILWANLHLLFWLSLVPFTTAWLGRSGGGEWPAVIYGAVLLMAACAYFLLVHAIVALHGQSSELAKAIGSDLKGKLSPAFYAAAIGLAFVDERLSYALYVLVAAMWFIPDRRIESHVRQ
ncbi:MAG TPA: TMEM175 family protein [Myxococcales bacterium]